jgi:hypothetical protein
MKELIEALNIFLKYAPDEKYPTHCEHDELFIVCVEYDNVSPEDRAKLEELGFVKNEHGQFSSFRFGSA